MLEEQPHDQLEANAASPMTKIRGSLCLPSACRAVIRGLPCLLAIVEAALAANLISQLDDGLMFKHLERNLAKQAAPESAIRLIWPR